jgi:hypothetical protein
MRFLITSTIVACFVVAPMAAVAQVPTLMTAGTVVNALARSATIWCSIDRGNSTFQRTGTGAALMSFPDITYTKLPLPPASPNNAPTYHALSGQARLSFTTTNSGYIFFDLPPPYAQSIRQPKFVHYTQTYSASSKLLSVGFDIQFPQCTLRVDGRYNYY